MAIFGLNSPNQKEMEAKKALPNQLPHTNNSLNDYKATQKEM